ncbi:MAG: decarboxylase [Flavobacterium sp.]|nr:MAG: decarboxylase [Flavobacterium sp.]
MKILIAISTVAILSFQSCNQQGKNSAKGVQHAGTLQEIMSGKLDASISLKELQEIPNLYALGAAEGLKGEIQIFNSKPYVSSVTPEQLVVENDFSSKAALLVYAQVPEWQEVSIPKAILTLKQFEDFLEYSALKAEIDTSKPFPFMIEGHIRKINWHVVNWNENNVNHSREAHMASGLNGIVVEENVEIIGFYSKDHKGVYTHHNANWHMHFRAKDQNLAGHLDDLLLGEYMTLKLPKQL